MPTSRLVWGYAVWGAMGVVIAVPELWAAVGGKSVEWPTISGTVGYLEYWHSWAAVMAVQYEVSKGSAAPAAAAAAVPGGAYRTPGGRVSRRAPTNAPFSAI